MKKRSPIHAYKRLLARDQDWDYAFLIACVSTVVEACGEPGMRRNGLRISVG